MDHLNTANLNLKKNGWKLVVNDQETHEPKIGDIVQIVAEVVSPLDYEEGKEIRSVSHETLWVRIEEMKAEGIIAVLKTKPGHDFEMKDGTRFQIGDKILFTNKNILSKKV